MSTKITGKATAMPNDVHASSTIQEFDLGAQASGSDGSIYRYCKVGATALVAGKLYDGPAEIANHQNIAVASAAAAGATSVTVTLGATAATANQYSGGWLVVNDAAGEGFTYGINSNPAADASASLTLTLEDNTPIITALTTSSEVTLIPNQYNGVIIHAASETGVPVGVAMTNIVAASFGWLKTGGVAGVLQDASAAEVGKSVGASTTTDGSVTANDGTLKEVGTMLATGVSTEYNPVFLTIDQ